MIDETNEGALADLRADAETRQAGTSTVEPMDRTDNSLIALRRILRATEKYGRELARGAGLTAVQLRVLQIIAENGGCHPSEIATRMGVSQATVSVLIKKLEGFGMLERRQSVEDRRQIDLIATRAGLATVEAAPDALQQRYVASFERLPDWEQALIVSVLERVAGMLDGGQFEPAPVLATDDLHRPEQDGTAAMGFAPAAANAGPEERESAE